WQGIRFSGARSFTPVIEALHKIIPEYPQLHWRYLNDNLKDRVKAYYENQQFGAHSTPSGHPVHQHPAT
ncbi:hypothetical protein, partial [Pseudomonas syringae]|uniref:hypothetical protein n=1 Tax=Pseudomonas syringae TaxID=317 RepID=UPI001E5C89AE